MHVPVAVAWSSSDGIAICYVLPVLRMTSYFRTVGPMGGRTGTAVCSSPAPVDVAAGRARAAAAHWLAGSAGRLAGWLHRPGRALAVRRLDSAAAGDGGAHFAACFMQVVSCAPGAKSASHDCLFFQEICKYEELVFVLLSSRRRLRERRLQQRQQLGIFKTLGRLVAYPLHPVVGLSQCRSITV